MLKTFICLVLVADILLPILLTFCTVRFYTRSSNALDELYYATIDERCDAFGPLDDWTWDVLAAKVSPLKCSPPSLMPGVEVWDRSPLRAISQELGEGWKCGINRSRMQSVCTYCYGIDRVRERSFSSLSWGADNDSLYASRLLEFDVGLPLERLSNDSRASSYVVKAIAMYDVDNKRLWVQSLSVSERNGERVVKPMALLDTFGIGQDAVDQETVRIIKEELLPAFLTRGGAVPCFSADFEQDGVAVELPSAQTTAERN